MTIEEPEPAGRVTQFVEDLIVSALAIVPVVGGVIEPHFLRAVGAGAAANLSNWQREVTKTLNAVVAIVGVDEVEQRLSTADSAATLSATTATAMRDPRPEKMAMLGQAVRSVLMDVEPDADLRYRFLALIDRHSVTDVRLLRVMANPLAAGMAAGAQRADLMSAQDCIFAALPSMRPDKPAEQALNDDDLVTQYGRGLERDGLIKSWQPTSKRRPETNQSSVFVDWHFTSVLGDRYLNFLGENPVHP